MDDATALIAAVERLDVATFEAREQQAIATRAARAAVALAMVLTLAGCGTERTALAECKYEVGKAVVALPTCAPDQMIGACAEVQRHTLVLACMLARGFEPVEFPWVVPDLGEWQRTDRISEAWRSLFGRSQK